MFFDAGRLPPAVLPNLPPIPQGQRRVRMPLPPTAIDFLITARLAISIQAVPPSIGTHAPGNQHFCYPYCIPLYKHLRSALSLSFHGFARPGGAGSGPWVVYGGPFG